MDKPALNLEEASRFADLALKGVCREYPNKLDHAINGEGDIRTPRELHPAFYGCFDWHSSVHGHWMLVRLLRLLPELPRAQEIRAALDANLSAENLLAEVAYLEQPNRRSFERTYGWAWLLKLAEELYTWAGEGDDADARQWSRNLQPLADAFVARYLGFLPKQTYPIRGGTHPNTAFGLAFALDYARTTPHVELERLIVERSLAYFAADTDYPVRWEPGGSDFLSSALVEADLMTRVLPSGEFRGWLARFLPGLERGEPANLFEPAIVADRTDPQIVHLDGLNLSRAWCMRSIANALSPDDPAHRVLVEAANRHAQASLPHIASGDYMGEHWLASFAVYLLTEQNPSQT
ncbi:MAG: DUF2891 domain-containing protein [Chloroflexota bacterium]|nr:DUF2891 domain-containing protein [Chloroflexota bacterium]